MECQGSRGLFISSATSLFIQFFMNNKNENPVLTRERDVNVWIRNIRLSVYGTIINRVIIIGVEGNFYGIFIS